MVLQSGLKFYQKNIHVLIFSSNNHNASLSFIKNYEQTYNATMSKNDKYSSGCFYIPHHCLKTIEAIGMYISDVYKTNTMYRRHIYETWDVHKYELYMVNT